MTKWLRTALSRLTPMVFATAVCSAAFAVSTPLRITEVNPNTAQVEVTNISVNIFTAPADLPFSYRTTQSTVITSGTSFAAGESKTISVPGLDLSDSDIWLFTDTNFSNPASIESGMKYGPASDVGQTSVAVAAGIWPSTSAFVTAPSPTQSLRLTKYVFNDPTAWAAGTSTFGSFFGTGTAITNPIVPTIQKGQVQIELQPYLTGMASPLGMAYPDDGTDRVFVYDQAGSVTLVLNGVRQSTAFIDVASRLVSFNNYDERGLLGFCFHPNFAANPKVYTYTSEPVSGNADFVPPVAATADHDNVIAEWTVSAGNPNVIDPATRRELIRIRHPATNHNGGTLRFGPDNMLYFSIGDGGTSDDQGNGHQTNGNAQYLNSIFGKVLRIDPDGSNSTNGKYGIPADNPFVATAGAVKEIYAYGLRNPYAYSFDRQNGDLYVGDAGQNKVEEADIVTSGANCGWRLKEGSFFFDPTGTGFVTTIPFKPIPDGLTEPFTEYDHSDGVVIVGGFVYRGNALPQLQGKYITGDFSNGGFSTPLGRLFFADGTQQQPTEFRIGLNDRPLGLFLKGFGEDKNGELYICASTILGPRGGTGQVLKIIPVPNYVSLLDDQLTSTLGWSQFGTLTPTQQIGYDSTNTALLASIATTTPGDYRIIGWFTDAANTIHYSSVGTDHYVRAKYYIYAAGQSGGAINEIPNFRLRVANRFAVSSLLLVSNHNNADPEATTLAQDIRPSTAPASPSLYRVDLDPIDVPQLVLNPSTEGFLRAFEAYEPDPQANGDIAMTECILGTYRALADSSTTVPVTQNGLIKRYRTDASGGGDFGTGDILNSNSAATIAKYFQGAEETSGALPTINVSSAGVTLETLNVESDRLGVAAFDVFNDLGDQSNHLTRARVEPGKQYKVRFHATSTKQSNTQSVMRFRARTIKFQYTASLEVGGATGASAASNTIAAQALPGIGNSIPTFDRINPSENGGWYNLPMFTPMTSDIQTTQPNLYAQDGPGVDTSPANNKQSRRDLQFGFDVLDTFSTNPSSGIEAGQMTVDQVDIEKYDLIPD